MLLEEEGIGKLLLRQLAVTVLVELLEAVASGGLGFGLNHRGTEDTEEQNGVMELWSHEVEMEAHAMIPFTTFPFTSVSRMSRPAWRKVSLVCSRPRRWRMVACQSWMWTGSMTLS